MSPYIKGLYTRKNKIVAEIESYQNRCSHPDVVKTPKANTGNYDPSEDRYWYDCVCETCNKFWVEDQ